MPWYNHLLIFISQLLMFIFRTMNVQYIAKGDEMRSIVSSVLFQVSWLFTTYIGVTNIMKGNWLIVLSFLLGTVVGTKIGFLVKKHI